MRMALLAHDARDYRSGSLERQARPRRVEGEQFGPRNRSAMAEAIHLLVFAGACAGAWAGSSHIGRKTAGGVELM